MDILDALDSGNAKAILDALEHKTQWDGLSPQGFTVIDSALEAAVTRKAENDDLPNPKIAKLVLAAWARDTFHIQDSLTPYQWLSTPLDVECLTWQWEWAKDFGAESLLQAESDYASVEILRMPLNEEWEIFIEQPYPNSLFEGKPTVRAINVPGFAFDKDGVEQQIVKRIFTNGATKSFYDVCCDAEFAEGNDIAVSGRLEPLWREIHDQNEGESAKGDPFLNRSVDKSELSRKRVDYDGLPVLEVAYFDEMVFIICLIPPEAIADKSDAEISTWLAGHNKEYQGCPVERREGYIFVLQPGYSTNF